MYQLFAGLFAEGTTDIRFLENIVQKTLEKVAFECQGQIEVVLNPIEVDKSGLSFIEQVEAASKKGVEDFGMMLLCVHKDADSSSDKHVLENSMIPAQKALKELSPSEYCTIMVSIIPIQETEAWMLADKDLLKKQIGTDKSDLRLGINHPPENTADPKTVIIEAIRIAREEMSKKRRRKLTIADLYLPIGQGIDMEKLEQLSSYQKFKENVRIVFRELNLLHN